MPNGVRHPDPRQLARLAEELLSNPRSSRRRSRRPLQAGLETKGHIDRNIQTVLGPAQSALTRGPEQARHQARGHPGQPDEPELQGRQAPRRAGPRAAPPQARRRDGAGRRPGSADAPAPEAAPARRLAARAGTSRRPSAIQLGERAGRRGQQRHLRHDRARRPCASSGASARLLAARAAAGPRTPAEAALRARAARPAAAAAAASGPNARLRQGAVHDDAVEPELDRPRARRRAPRSPSMSRGSGAVTSTRLVASLLSRASAPSGRARAARP